MCWVLAGDSGGTATAAEGLAVGSVTAYRGAGVAAEMTLGWRETEDWSMGEGEAVGVMITGCDCGARPGLPSSSG